MDQDGFSIAIFFAAVAVLVSGLMRREFALQFFRAARSERPVAYWASALLLLLVAAEAFRRAWLLGCVEC